MKSDDERMKELTEGVQKIFRDAVNQPPIIASGEQKDHDHV